MENLVLTSLTVPEVRNLLRTELETYFLNRSPVNAVVLPEEFLTRKEAAELLSISLPTLSDWTKRGDLTGYRIGSRIRYKKSELVTSLVQIQSVK